MEAEQAWQSALGQLQMEMPKASFDTWVRDTSLVAYEEGVFTVAVPMPMLATGWKAAYPPLQNAR